MELGPISEIAKTGMAFERSRVELASTRLALANTAYSSAADAIKAARSLTNQGFGALITDNASSPDQISIKPIKDPSHPSADSTGTVYFLDIDPIHEMATLVSALRSYEANVRAYNTNSDMTKSALSIGGGQ